MPGLGIAHDVRRVEQVPQAADGAGLLVRPEHPCAEDRLVQAEFGYRSAYARVSAVGRLPAAGQETHVLVIAEPPDILLTSYVMLDLVCEWDARAAAANASGDVATGGSMLDDDRPGRRRQDMAKTSSTETTAIGRVRKVSVSLPETVLQSVRKRVGPGQFSAYVASALMRQLELDRLAAYVAEVEDELGRPISDDLMAEAEAAWHGG